VAGYFLLFDGNLFAERLRPALAAGWRQRSFSPCRELCQSLLPHVAEFDRRYHVGEGASLIKEVARGLTFDRAFWRTLVGELLFYAADEIPEFQTCPDTLCCLLAPEHYRQDVRERERLAPVQQAHLGSRPLTFGAVAYRREQCGLNDREDVRRLADYLDGINPADWQAADLALLRESLDEEDRAEELAIAREWLEPLRQMYRQAAGRGQVIVHEFF
jgi:hypothetical protein